MSKASSHITCSRRAETRRIQFKLDKGRWGMNSCKVLGFICGGGVRKVDPKKVQQIRDWPAPKTPDDLRSFVQFCSFLKEYFGPGYHEHMVKFKPYLKKNPKFDAYHKDTGAQQAFSKLRAQRREPIDRAGVRSAVGQWRVTARESFRSRRDPPPAHTWWRAQRTRGGPSAGRRRRGSSAR